jgi:hypothetical protein
MSLPFDAIRCLALSINPDADSGGFRGANRGANSGAERGRIQCSEHGSGILVDDSEQSASRRFWDPPPSLPVLDSVKAEPERVREPGLRHAKSISDGFHVNFLGHMCLESFLLPSKESLNVVQAIHHLLELRFHAISPCVYKMPSKIRLARVLSALRSAMDRFSFSFFRKNRNKKNRKSLIAPDIHNPPPTAFPHSLARDPNLSKSARSTNQVSTLRVSRNQRYDVRTLLLAKELVGNREVSRRLDNRLHNPLVLHWTPSVKQDCVPLDTTVWRLFRGILNSARGYVPQARQDG